MGDDNMIPALVKKHDIDEIIIAVPLMKNDDLRRIVRLIPAKGCRVRMLYALSANKAEDAVWDIDIEDLLGRFENMMDYESIGAWVKGKTVLITGGGGSIGSEICRQLMDFNLRQIVIYDISENNAFNLRDELLAARGQKGRERVYVRIGSIQDKARLDEVFGEFKPHIVFHAAAYKHVPLMEQCPRLAVENNAWGTYVVTLCALKNGVERFVMVSTDKAVNPTSVMGATKRLAELLVLGQNAQNSTEFVCVRFGNVLESNGSVVPTFKRQIAAGGPITLTHPDISRYFMSISEAAQLVLEAGAMAQGGEIFILNMGAPVKIMDLAEKLIVMAGLVPHTDIKIEISGLRPGEKLHEELSLNEEGLRTTLNDKIFVVTPGPPRDFENMAADLAKYVNSPGGADARELLKQFVPEYTSQ
jgi:FlaA1/EpsC-like NDP-sugar epimerase